MIGARSGGSQDHGKDFPHGKRLCIRQCPGWSEIRSPNQN